MKRCASGSSLHKLGQEAKRESLGLSKHKRSVSCMSLSDMAAVTVANHVNTTLMLTTKSTLTQATQCFIEKSPILIKEHHITQDELKDLWTCLITPSDDHVPSCQAEQVNSRYEIWFDRIRRQKQKQNHQDNKD